MKGRIAAIAFLAASPLIGTRRLSRSPGGSEMYLIRAAIATFLATSLAACGLFDSGVPWRDGAYELLWIDLPDQVSLSYDTGNGGSIGLVDYTVFSVGSNARYLVAKQHPKGNKAITNFFIVDKADGNLPLHPERAVRGPLTEPQFENDSRGLNLPRFTEVLDSLQ